MRATFLAAPLVLALFLQPSVVMAQVQIDARASNLRYTLGDLDPSDALQPAIHLNPIDLPSLEAAVTVYGADGRATHEAREQRWHWDARVPLVLGFAPYVDVRASASGGEQMDTVHGDAWVKLNDPEARMSVVGRADSAPGAFYFELAPMSSFTFTVDVTLGLAAGSPGPGVFQEGLAWAMLYAGPLSYPDHYDPVQDTFSAALGHQPDGGYLPSRTLTRTLSVTLNNDDTSAWKTGGVSFYLTATGRVAVSPVPEPAGGAMWLAGSLMAGLAAWRRGAVQARSISRRMRRRQRSRPAE